MDRTFGFDVALVRLITGSSVQRTGWNGKGQYISLGNHVETTETGASVIRIMWFHGVDGRRVPWCPSQTDLLERDWRVWTPPNLAIDPREETVDTRAFGPGERSARGPGSYEDHLRLQVELDKKRPSPQHVCEQPDAYCKHCEHQGLASDMASGLALLGEIARALAEMKPRVLESDNTLSKIDERLAEWRIRDPHP